MDRVHQGRTIVVLPIELIKINAGEHEGGDLPLVEAHAREVAAVGQQVRSQKDIGGLVMLDGDHLLGKLQIRIRLILKATCSLLKLASCAYFVNA